MRPPFARAAAIAAVAALTLTSCSGAPDEGGDATSASTSTSTSSTTSSSSTTPSPTVEVDGAGKGLTDAVTKKYGSQSVTGTATAGRWRGAKVAVVTSDDDVTLAVRPKGKQWRVVGGWWPSMDEGPDLGKGPRHVLVLGSDARPGEKVTRLRADAIQLLGVDGSGGAGVMGFARDLWVPIPGHGHGKLNASMVYGGPGATVGAVSRTSGIDVDGYVVTGFTGFRAIVDELGPLSFDAPMAVRSHLPGGVIPKGKSRLGGRKALAYARERKTLPHGDFDRSRHQGLLLLAAAIQARVQGPDSLPRALTVIDEHASSDLTATQMLRFSASFYRVNPLKVGHEVAQGPTGMQSGQSIVRLGQGSKQDLRSFRDGRL
ncbi:LCP family protein [Janibacter cremeus]|uniref:LCP family protein required for cell wall assembly n=1 Tax=Janibacter cremeus TaxID=1285192 RepID=A0A852VWH0_9MICO|nr:LCP family protein required for cell wall assembly [Janibacter cremeus]